MKITDEEIVTLYTVMGVMRAMRTQLKLDKNVFKNYENLVKKIESDRESCKEAIELLQQEIDALKNPSKSTIELPAI